MKSKLKDACLREIKKNIDSFYKYPNEYDFHATTQEQHEKALLKEIKDIIRRFEILRK